MTEALLRAVLVVLGVLLGGSVAALFGHAAWLRLRERRDARLLAPARTALRALLAGPGDAAAHAETLASLRRLPPRLRRRLVVELVPRLEGSARARMTQVARELGVVDRAERRLRSPFWWRRLEAARTLTPLAEPAGFVPLLGDRNAAVRAQAVAWAGENPSPALAAVLLEMFPGSAAIVRSAVEDALLRAGPAVAEPLRAYLEAREGEAVLPALRVARGIAQPAFVPAALRLCRDPLPEARAQAAALLGTVGGEEGTAQLTSMLGDPHPRPRAAAVAGLGRLRYWPAAAAIAERLRDPAWEVRVAAGMALRALESPGRLLLRRYRGDTDRFAADMARRTLEIPADVAEERR